MSRARDLADGNFSGDLEADSPTFVVDSANNRVGIGTSSPSAKLTASALTGTTVIQALGADTNGFADVEIKSTGSAGASRLYFSDTDAQSGLIRYSHSSNSMEFTTASSERMRIDSAGRVTMPYQPCFNAVLNADWDYTGGGNRALVPFDDVRFNVGGHFNTGTSKFTAPVSGKYLLTARLSTNSVATGNYFSVDFMKNDSSYSLGWNGDDGTNYRFVAASVIMDMAANDTAHIGTEIANNVKIEGNSDRSFFAGYLIG